MQLYGLNCVCREKNKLNFVGSGKIWAEICGIKYGMHYESKKKYYMGLIVVGSKSIWAVIEKNGPANTTLNRFRAHELCGI